MIIEKVKELNPVDRLVYWITEREKIRIAKEAGQPKPWTDDIILQSYRFCNVHREDDKVTRWIAENLREKNLDNPHLWFIMCVARLINLPACLEELKKTLPDAVCPWNQGAFVACLHSRRKAGLPMFNGAYIVSTNGRSMDKAQYVAQYVLTPLWDKGTELRPRDRVTLASWAELLGENMGMGTFMSGQVVADLKYVLTCPLSKALDWRTWAAPGPGSKRGLNRVFRRHPNSPWGKHWLSSLQELLGRNIESATTSLGTQLKASLHAQDLQNCLCEFDKYERILHGEGRPKQKYPGRGND